MSILLIPADLWIAHIVPYLSLSDACCLKISSRYFPGLVNSCSDLWIRLLLNLCGIKYVSEKDPYIFAMITIGETRIHRRITSKSILAGESFRLNKKLRRLPILGYVDPYIKYLREYIREQIKILEDKIHKIDMDNKRDTERMAMLATFLNSQ